MAKRSTKRILNLGLGFTNLGQSKIQEMSSQLEKKYGLSSKEGKKLAKDLIDMTQKTSKQVIDAVNDQFHFMLENTLGIKKSTKKKIIPKRTRKRKK